MSGGHVLPKSRIELRYSVEAADLRLALPVIAKQADLPPVGLSCRLQSRSGISPKIRRAGRVPPRANGGVDTEGPPSNAIPCGGRDKQRE